MGSELKRRRSTSRKKRNRQFLLAGGAIDSAEIADASSVADARSKPKSNNASKFDYIRETKRPVICLAFVLPMLLLYELGSIFSDQLSGKSGIDQWFHWFMDLVGAGHLVILPVLTAGVLLFWHHRLNDAWQFRPSVLAGMLAESCCLGLTLYFAGNAVYQLISEHPTAALSIGEVAVAPCWKSTIAFIGCGVYEELIFRLLLLGGLIHVGKSYLREIEAKTAAMIITSLIFAALHYNFFNPAGAVFDANGFLFRFFASLIFCVLFLFRGFGIAVGTHAVYDVMTQI